jgi:hypothetical protein
MTLRHTTKFLSCAAALLSLGASVAVAQTQPRSTKRIPISKESPGEVATTRVDTVTVYRTDTLRTLTTDTVRLSGQTVYRVDTVTMAPMMRPVRLPYGVYFGLAGGVSAPNGALFTPNSAGPSAQAQLGWQSHWLGLRGDANWAKPGEDSRFSGLQADPDILNFSADAKLDIPFLTHMFGSTHRFGVYGIGGYTHTMYKNLPMRLNTFDAFGNPQFMAGQGSWTHENGWNAGGGLSLGWGRTELFLESRVLAFHTNVAPQARQIPFMFGVNVY